ncbi:hypothetical protein PFLUV_G00002350 [Perca fluviatilis]|uniref:Uncharacterized protein n=1 Tax=Perca fluviatilis TaxID=8168 RepID=A0A6A5FQ72_PERFL|nr:hypothetical protein PFLUV_G00002350 [Perca fluviatilis]
MRREMLHSVSECIRSPPSQIWLNVTCRLGAERGFLAEPRREQEPSGSVCLSVCLSARRRRRRSLSSVWDTHKKTSFFRLPRSGLGISGYGCIAVLLLFSPLRDVTPSDAPVPIEEEEGGRTRRGASLSFFDYKADSPLERLNTEQDEEEEEEEV